LLGVQRSYQRPTIEAVEGDRVRIYVTNRLPAAPPRCIRTALSCGTASTESPPYPPAILPGETFKQEFTIRQHGTFMYHSHPRHDDPGGDGLTECLSSTSGGDSMRLGTRAVWPTGILFLLLQEWRIEVGAERPNPFNDQVNLFTITAASCPTPSI